MIGRDQAEIEWAIWYDSATGLVATRDMVTKARYVLGIDSRTL